MHRSVHGEIAEWGPVEHLLAHVADRLMVLIWQQTVDGHKGRNQPKPIPRPGVSDPDVERLRPKGRSIDEMRQLLDDWNAGRLEDSYKPTGEKVVM